MANVQIATRVPEEIKAEWERLAGNIGLTVSEAIKMILTIGAREHRIPVRIDEPQLQFIKTGELPARKGAKQFKLTANSSGRWEISNDLPKELLDAWEI